jgi:hypothetical protein
MRERGRKRKGKCCARDYAPLGIGENEGVGMRLKEVREKGREGEGKEMFHTFSFLVLGRSDAHHYF